MKDKLSRSKSRISLLLPFVALVAFCSHNLKAVEAQLNKIRTANPYIQRAAKAVVKINKGTGFFIKTNNHFYLVTNHHVLGPKKCAITGCYMTVEIRGKQKKLFIKPHASDPSLDVIFLKAYHQKEKSPFHPAHYLKANNSTLKVTRGTQIAVIGHPRQSILKWSQGIVTEVDLNMLKLNAFALPGNSGSPILTTKGELVGVYSSSVKANDLINESGVLFKGLGAPFNLCIKVLDRPKSVRLHKFIDPTKPISFKRATKYLSAYLNARITPQMESKNNFEYELYKACLKQSKQIITNKHNPLSKCQYAKKWLTGAKFKKIKNTEKWAELFKVVANKLEKTPGADPLPFLTDAICCLDNEDFKYLPYKNLRSYSVKLDNKITLPMLLQYSKHCPHKEFIKRLVFSYKLKTQDQGDYYYLFNSVVELCKRKILTKAEAKKKLKSLAKSPLLTLKDQLKIEVALNKVN